MGNQVKSYMGMIYFLFLKKAGGGVELFFVISGYSMALITFEKQKIDWQKYFIPPD